MTGGPPGPPPRGHELEQRFGGTPRGEEPRAYPYDFEALARGLAQEPAVTSHF